MEKISHRCPVKKAADKPNDGQRRITEYLKGRERLQSKYRCGEQVVAVVGGDGVPRWGIQVIPLP